jgi:D-arabinose 1-dehydrogenase-like Zn-dependent alcohol dehydrogenase
MFPDGVGAVLDFVSDGETLKRFAPLVVRGGTLVTTIHVADEAWFAAQQRRAVNLVMNQTPESSAAGLDELTDLVRRGELVVAVAGERPLEDARHVLDESERHTLHGKFVLRPTSRN